MIKWWKHKNIENNNVISNYTISVLISGSIVWNCVHSELIGANVEVRQFALHWHQRYEDAAMISKYHHTCRKEWVQVCFYRHRKLGWKKKPIQLQKSQYECILCNKIIELQAKKNERPTANTNALTSVSVITLWWMTEAILSDWSRRLGASDFAKPVRCDGAERKKNERHQPTAECVKFNEFRFSKYVAA